jgi:uncharacterized protein with ParB-like and HNH nuclease domain
MQAKETSFLEFLSIPQQLVVPVYQRRYSWEQKQCRDLWNDISKMVGNQRTHFVGSVVYIKKIENASIIPEHVVIDGQQRLTSISLILRALYEKMKESKNSEIQAEGIKERYLINRNVESEKSLKLLLTKSDREIYQKIIIEGMYNSENSHKVIKNYNFFKKQIDKSEHSPESIFNALQRLSVVDIVLKQPDDNPQLIFESLNATGMDLSPADMIRNYILMGMDTKEQQKMYEIYWKPMEDSFADNTDGEWWFNEFIKAFLTVKNNEVPHKKDIYPKFKEFVRSQDKDIQKIIKEVFEYSRIFEKIAFQKFDDKRINNIVSGIEELELYSAYPFLMKIYIDYEAKLIKDDDELFEIYALTENFLFRRSICEVETNALISTFAAITNAIDKERYLESLKESFIKLKNRGRFPDDKEFSRAFVEKDIYSRKTYKANYLLEKLENFNSNEPISTEKLQIEHIMPQNKNLSEEWKQELGERWSEIQQQYLHTIGNLTKTGYNPKYSDKPFSEKKNMEDGFKDSQLRLNQYLAKLEKWDESEIIQRAKKLLESAVEIWKYPEVSAETLERIRLEEIEIEDEEDEEIFKRNLNEMHEELKNKIDTIITKVEQFDCFSEIKGDSICYYTEEPCVQKTRFVVIRCGRETSMISFRIDPRNFADDEEIREVGGYWFRPKGTERRIRVTKETMEKIFPLIENSYKITKT